jgi:hypothetical protein
MTAALIKWSFNTILIMAESSFASGGLADAHEYQLYKSVKQCDGCIFRDLEV